jgi:hypothetical protein
MVPFCMICNVTFLSHQENEHKLEIKHTWNKFEAYKFNFHTIPIPKRKRSLRNTSLLKTFNDRKMVALRHYWNMVGQFLYVGVSIGLKVVFKITNDKMIIWLFQLV